ncbi:MAG: TatD family hydrolase, partial [Lysobacter spongiicola]|nr:TatD family hydrolase [Lysobacter spongiicola]
QLADQGFLLGIGGPATYERAQRLRRTVANVPLEWLALETDAPDQPDSGIRGQRNEPARLAVIAQAVAELRGLAPAEVAAATSANVERIFRLAKAERESSAA